VLQGVHHAGVTVANLDRSLGFYRDVLGLEVFAVAERSDAAGYAPRSTAPVHITEGPNAGARSFYVRDPDGYTVELLQPPPGR
jgi:catechol 2,3-dioxygenase-like lactoylglutathione lyase family enzyme